MLEAGIALALLITLSAAGLALAVSPPAVVVWGFWVVGAGLAFGVPTGLVYHVALRRALLEAGRLPARWWLQPTALHGALPEAARARVLGWCAAGALGFVVTVAGCVLVAIGAVRTL
jgi:hypothetical protein